MRDLFGEELPDRSSRPCRACGAPLVWGKTTKGKAIPLDAAPSPCGNVNLRGDGTAEVLGPATAQTVRLGGVALYLSHFVTCPKAATFRKPKVAPGEGTGLVPAPSGNGVRAPLPEPSSPVAISDGSQDVDGFAPLEGLPLPAGWKARDLGDGWRTDSIEPCLVCRRGTALRDPAGVPLHRSCAEARQ